MAAQTIAEPLCRTAAMHHYRFAFEELEEQLQREETASLISARPEFHPDFVMQDQEGSLLSIHPHIQVFNYRLRVISQLTQIVLTQRYVSV